MRASRPSSSGWPANVGNEAKRLAGLVATATVARAALGVFVACVCAAPKALRFGATPLPPALIAASKLSRANGSDSGAGQRAEQAGRDHAVVPVRQRLHVEGDDALGRDAGRLPSPLSDRRWRRPASPSRRPA